MWITEGRMSLTSLGAGDLWEEGRSCAGSVAANSTNIILESYRPLMPFSYGVSAL